MTDSFELELKKLPKEWQDFAREISNDDFILNKIFGVDNNEKPDENEYCVFFTHSGSKKYFVFIKAFEFYDTTKNLGVDTIKPSYIDKGYFPIMDNKNSILKIRMHEEYKENNTTGLGTWSTGKSSMQNQGCVKKTDSNSGKIYYDTEDIEVMVCGQKSNIFDSEPYFYRTFFDMINGNTEKSKADLYKIRESFQKEDDCYKEKVKMWFESSEEYNKYKSSEHRLSDDTYEAVKELVNSDGNDEECKKFEERLQKDFEDRLRKLNNEKLGKLIELYQEKETEIKDKKETGKKAEIVKLEGESKTEDNKECEIQELKEKLAKLQKELEEKNKETEGLKQQLEELIKDLESKKVNKPEEMVGKIVDKMDKFLFGEQGTNSPEEAKKLVLESKEKSKEEVSNFSEDINKIIKQHVSENPQTTDQIIASCYNEVMTNRKINTEPWQVIKKDGFFVFKKDKSEFAVIGNDLCEVLPILTHFKCLPLEGQKLPYETNGVKICSVEEAVKGKIDGVKICSVEEVDSVRAAMSSEKTRGSSGTGITR